MELFGALGHREVTRIGGFDKGADITFVDEAGLKVGVQAKRAAGAVGIAAVRQLIDGMHRYGCDRGIVVTNSFFTEQAIECASDWGTIELWDRRRLADFLAGDAPSVDVTVCAECGRGVSPGVTNWCLGHPARYGGNVYCPRHQRRGARAEQVHAT